MEEEKIIIRAHPLQGARYLKRYVFVLLLPAAEGALAYAGEGSLSLFVIAELLLAAAIVTVSALKARRCRITVTGRTLLLQQGLFYKIEGRLDISKIASLYVERKLTLYPFGARSVKIDTEAKDHKKPDYALILSTKQAHRLVSLLELHPGKQPDYRYRAGIKSLIAISLASSSVTTGLLFFAPIINNAGNLLSKGLTGRLYDTLESSARYVEWLIPKVAGIGALLFVAGFLISFLLVLFRNAHFHVELRDPELIVRSGLINRNFVYMNRLSVNTLLVEQTPFMKLMNLYTAKISIAGYGKERGETATILPAAHYGDVQREMARILPDFTNWRSDIQPPKKSRRRFITGPILVSAAIPFLGGSAIFFMPYLWGFILLLTGALLLVALLWLWVEYIAWSEGGIAPGPVIRCYGSRFFTLVDMQCPREKVAEITLQQNLFQKKDNLCNIKITVLSERSTRLVIRHLDVSQVADRLGIRLEAQKKKST